MKDLSHLSNPELHARTQTLAAEERKITTEVLVHLNEVEKRKLHIEKGFKSIFEYAVQALKYSGAAASRRVNAMRLLQEVSEVSGSIEKGTLNLSSVSAVQTFLKREEKGRGKLYSPEEKRDLLQSLENKSKRECEKILATLSPLPSPKASPDKAPPALPNQTELKIVLKDEQMSKLEKVKNLLAPQNPEGSYGRLLELMAELVLDRMDPGPKKLHPLKKKLKKAAVPISEPQEDPVSQSELIPAFKQRQVWLRDKKQCTYIDPVTQKRCQVKRLLQIDHILPVTSEGQSEISNLRLVCHQHSQLEAFHKLDPESTSRYNH